MSEMGDVMKKAVLRFDFPAEVRGDPRFDRILDAVRHMWDGADVVRAKALDVAFLSAGLPVEPAWQAMAMAACAALAELYVQRDRPARDHA